MGLRATGVPRVLTCLYPPRWPSYLMNECGGYRLRAFATRTSLGDEGSLGDAVKLGIELSLGRRNSPQPRSMTPAERGRCKLLTEFARVLGAGVFVRECQMPSTSMPLSRALMPNSALPAPCSTVSVVTVLTVAVRCKFLFFGFLLRLRMMLFSRMTWARSTSFSRAVYLRRRQ